MIQAGKKWRHHARRPLTFNVASGNSRPTRPAFFGQRCDRQARRHTLKNDTHRGPWFSAITRQWFERQSLDGPSAKPCWRL